MSKNEPSISIVIPVLNEEIHIFKLLQDLIKYKQSKKIKEIIVADGGSTDNTKEVAKKLGAVVVSSAMGRATQLNYGAKNAKGDILYFLHADSIPPKNFNIAIINAYNDGYFAGSFQLKFDNKSRFLSFFAWFTRFNLLICRGGDQSLFIKKNLFNEINGYNENYSIYEDVEIISKIYKKAKFKILPDKVITSSRRYLKNGMIVLQWHFAMVHLKYFLGLGPQKIYDYYQKHIAR